MKHFKSTSRKEKERKRASEKERELCEIEREFAR